MDSQAIHPQVAIMNQARKDQGITGGKPKRFSPAVFHQKVDAWLEQEQFPTITKLAVYLDCDRSILYDTYDKDPEYADAIKRARRACEAALEGRALEGKANVAMAIFSLKNNYGWSDKVEVVANVDITSNGETVGQGQQIAGGFADYLKRSSLPIVEGEIAEQ